MHPPVTYCHLPGPGDKLAIIAETPPTGSPRTWINPAGIADYDGDGKLDIAYVTEFATAIGAALTPLLVMIGGLIAVGMAVSRGSFGFTSMRRRIGFIARRVVLCAILGSIPASAMAGSVEDLFDKAARGSTARVDHSTWDRLLKAYVIEGSDGLNRVDYAGFKRVGRTALDKYISSLEAVDPGRLDRSEQFAFLVNLYNAKTIALVLARYPVKSIKDVALGGGVVALFTGGPWKAKVMRLNGVELSLDDIEHVILRPLFKDPRVHYAVNCASIGCPNLSRDAFTGPTLDAQLDAAARTFINSPRAFRFEGDRLISSSIFTWFKADFGGNDEGVLRHATTYAVPALAARLSRRGEIDSDDYDWRLNDVAR